VTPLSLWQKLGPGFITGAADDDPSGIATYSQAGAAFGYGTLWTMIFTYPLMVGIQIISARIGCVTGEGLAANIRRHHPAWLLHGIVGLLLFANIINIAADVSAMGAALKLLVGGPAHLYAIAFGLLCIILQTFVPFERYSPLLKLMTLALFSYVATVFTVHVPWARVLRNTAFPSVTLNAQYLIVVVAVFGTTISPYLFFWQASEEVEEQLLRHAAPLKSGGLGALEQLKRITMDTSLGMGFSNTVAFFIILTAAVTLNAHGITDIQTSAQAAEALRPLAGDFTFWLFSAGIVGTGLLAVPVLAGSAAYAVAEAQQWPSGLGVSPAAAKGFYSIIAMSTILGVALNFSPIDPIKALFWSSVVNGVIAVPVMVMVMLTATRTDVMGPFVIGRKLKILGWTATIVMMAAVIAMCATWGR
jgi:Mn2+/Fe2+ NRAMP family transporter